MSEKPNIIFIVCDDLNDAIGGMGGHPQAKTPNIDRLMSRGIRFSNAQVNVPICGPSRSSFLSGLAPWSTGYFGYNFCRDPWWNNEVLGNSRTFMEHFGDNGYDVYGTGKVFHNGQDKMSVWKNGYGHETDWGPWTWDGQKKGCGWPSCVSHHNLPEGWDAELLFASLGDIPDIPPNAKTGAPGYKGWRNGQGKPFRYVSEDDRDLMPDELNAQYCENILTQTHDNPFLLCFGVNRPHSPLIAPQKYFDLFPLEDIELAVTKDGDVEDCCQIFRDGHTTTGRWGFERYKIYHDAGGEEMIKRWTQAYLASVAFVDDQIGKVMDALDKSAYAENTYIVITSDNGYHMGEKDYLFKNSLWEEAARVPLVVYGPRAQANTECDTPVSLIDLFPTFNELCDLPTDVNAKYSKQDLDGTSFVPLLENPVGGKWDGPEMAITAVGSDTPLDQGQPGAVKDQHYSVRSKTHRYILCSNGEEELYDHINDPYEWTNIADDSAQNDIKDKMRQALRNGCGR